MAASARDSAVTTAPPDTAALVIGNQTVHVFRGQVGQIGPEQRVEMAAERVGMAARPGPDSVRVITDSLGAIILLNEVPVFIVMAADLPPGLGVLPRLRLCGGFPTPHGARCRRGSRKRAGHRDRGRFRGGGHAAPHLRPPAAGARTVVAGDERASPDDSRPEDQRRANCSPPTACAPPPPVARRPGWVAGLLLAYTWITFSLTRFAYTRPWGMVFGRFLASTADRIGLAILHSIPGLITAC